jgi:tRNA-Thr(GGU) m(6)t(6)A37 methyltransferase TsaA
MQSGNREGSPVELIYAPIGVIRSPHKETEGAPIQPPGASGIGGTVEIDPRFADGLRDLEGFSHVWLLYHFHRHEGFDLAVRPFLDDTTHGVFATRAPRRPNAIGLSVVRLLQIEGSRLHIQDVDVVDGTPLLDLKPYVPAFDVASADRIGWMTGRDDRAGHTLSDGRFGG